MQLTKHTDIALRVMMFLALKNSELSTIPQISRQFNVSNNHLRKVVNKLAGLGYIISHQGRGGGIELAYPADKITVAMIIRDMEATLDLIDCETSPCPIRSMCELKHAVNQAAQLFLSALDEHTIADLVKPKKQLVRLLA